jgi:hypothetical protein
MITCNCGGEPHSFEVSAININCQKVKVNEKLLSVQYFVCPVCSKVYPVTILPAEMSKDLRKQKQLMLRISKQRQKELGKNEGPSNQLLDLIQLYENKKQKLENANKENLEELTGEFVLRDAGDIIYLP